MGVDPRGAGLAAGAPSESAGPCVAIDIPLGYDPYCERLLTPRAHDEGKLRCVVRLASDRRRDMCMHVEQGNVFLLAARREGKRWLVGATPGFEAGNALMEIVSVGDRGKKAFACRRAHTGTNTNESMYILQSTRLLSQDLPEINSMDVALPADDYDSDPATSGHGVGILNGEKLGDPTWFCTQLERAPGELERHLQDALMGKPMHNVMLLQTRLPRWNAMTDSFELPFHGRANMASERNFQLIVGNLNERQPANPPVVLVHGKLEDDVFSLDFTYPLSPLHAFGLTLVTWAW